MHYSGILLEWIEKNHPDYILKLRQCVAAGQIEMITGGYYEPILSVIPEHDRQGQIGKLSEYIKKKTGGIPEGFWCAERIWEPALAESLVQAGIQYSILDDTHFKCAGLRDEDLYGYFITEHLGNALRLFPISTRLRYTIPFQDPQVTIDYCRKVAQTGENLLLVFADDGEKFGIWPETYDHVYTNGWLESFFRLLEENHEWIRLIHFREAIKRLPPHGQVYLPTASYMEMMQWTLPARGFREYEIFENRLKADGLWDQFGIYVRGGIWRNFFMKYPESNHMHKKMIRVSQKLTNASLPRQNRKKAENRLWAGQCNCPYWHGVFGGLYLPHLRHANFSELIKAEQIIDQGTHPSKNWVHSEITDFNTDGYDEALIENDRINLYFSPLGGRMIELDDRIAAHNYLNLLDRREEGYHQKLREINQSKHPDGQVASIHDRVSVKEDGLDQYLIYDGYRRGGWIDHFMSDSTTLTGFLRNEYEELGDFLQTPYQIVVQSQNESINLHLSREGTINQQGKKSAVKIEKTFAVKPGSSQIDIDYNLTNLSENFLCLWFGIEHGFAFHSGDDPSRYFQYNQKKMKHSLLDCIQEIEGVNEFSITDRYMKTAIGLKWDLPANLWRFPIETVSMSESGFERVYQGTVVILHWKMELSPGMTKTLKLVEQIENSKGQLVKKS